MQAKMGIHWWNMLLCFDKICSPVRMWDILSWELKKLFYKLKEW